MNKKQKKVLVRILITAALLALLNLVHIRKKRRLDYIVVLGCAVFGQKIPPLLAGRLDKAIQLMACNPNAKLICSGGQGPGEDIPEGEAMAAYAVAHGVPEEKIIRNFLMPDIFCMIMQPMMLLMKKQEKCTGNRRRRGCLTRALIPGGVTPQSRFPVRTGAVR